MELKQDEMVEVARVANVAGRDSGRLGLMVARLPLLAFDHFVATLLDLHDNFIECPVTPMPRRHCHLVITTQLREVARYAIQHGGSSSLGVIKKLRVRVLESYGNA
jgi:hypothetical protein